MSNMHSKIKENGISYRRIVKVIGEEELKSLQED